MINRMTTSNAAQPMTKINSAESAATPCIEKKLIQSIPGTNAMVYCLIDIRNGEGLGFGSALTGPGSGVS